MMATYDPEEQGKISQLETSPLTPLASAQVFL